MDVAFALGCDFTGIGSTVSASIIDITADVQHGTITVSLGRMHSMISVLDVNGLQRGQSSGVYQCFLLKPPSRRDDWRHDSSDVVQLSADLTPPMFLSSIGRYLIVSSIYDPSMYRLLVSRLSGFIHGWWGSFASDANERVLYINETRCMCRCTSEPFGVPLISAWCCHQCTMAFN